jgi:hypothetical protein
MEPAIFQFVAQCLNHYDTACPPIEPVYSLPFLILICPSILLHSLFSFCWTSNFHRVTQLFILLVLHILVAPFSCLFVKLWSFI